MDTYIELKAKSVKNKIEADFKDIDEHKLNSFFEKSFQDKRTLAFTAYYNRTVLDKEKIKFGEFKRLWAIQGMTKEVYSFFDQNYEFLKKEILEKKNIKDFFEKYCTKVRKEGSFCSKLFHTFLPDEFSPVDNPIRKHFGLEHEDFIAGVLIIKRTYGLFIEEHPELLKLIRKVLSKEKFSYMRIDEISDMRILDMFYWFQKSRKIGA